MRLHLILRKPGCKNKSRTRIIRDDTLISKHILDADRHTRKALTASASPSGVEIGLVEIGVRPAILRLGQSRAWPAYSSLHSRAAWFWRHRAGGSPPNCSCRSYLIAASGSRLRRSECRRPPRTQNRRPHSAFLVRAINARLVAIFGRPIVWWERLSRRSRTRVLRSGLAKPGQPIVVVCHFLRPQKKKEP